MFSIKSSFTNKSAFTLTELIVVITILSILSVIGFVVMSHQSSVARDGKRISDIQTLSESARITSAQLRLLPTPIADSIALTVSGTFIGYQGFMSTSIVNPLGYGSDKIFDPKDNIPYTYRVNQHYDQAQFMAYLENPRFERSIEIASQSLPHILSDSLSASLREAIPRAYALNTAYALDSSGVDLSVRYPYAAGDRLGIFLSKGSNQPLQNGVTGTGSRDISLSDISTLDIIVGSQGDDEYVSTDISTGSLLSLKDGSFDEKSLLAMNSGTSGSGSGNGSIPPVSYAMGNRIAAAAIHSCLLKTDGTVVCWGSNNDVLFGGGAGQTSVPSGLSDVYDMSSGYSSLNCALKTDGTVACWGGRGSVVESALGSDLIQIDIGVMHGCGVHTDGTVSCGGDNSLGQSDILPGLSNVSQVSAGYLANCALKIDATVTCWGSNMAGQLDVPSGLSDVTQISVGVSHACALKMNSTVVCWGNPSVLGSGNDQGQAIVPSNLGNVIQISAGYLATCAVKDDETVVCWGTPVLITPPSGLTGVTQISVGYGHICALKSGDDGVCWGTIGPGLSDYGQMSWMGVSAPAVPTGLALTPGDTDVNVRWNPVSTAISYTLAWNTNSGAYTEITGITGTGYVHTGLTNGATYNYKIKAINASGESGYSSVVIGVPNASYNLIPGSYTLTYSGTNVGTFNGYMGQTFIDLYASYGYSVTPNSMGSVSPGIIDGKSIEAIVQFGNSIGIYLQSGSGNSQNITINSMVCPGDNISAGLASYSCTTSPFGSSLVVGEQKSFTMVLGGIVPNTCGLLPEEITQLNSIQGGAQNSGQSWCDRTYLDFSNKGLTELPSALSKLNQLQNLYFQNNSITALPTWVGTSFPSLQFFNGSNNLITSIPETFHPATIFANYPSGLTQTIQLQNNQITSLPNSWNNATFSNTQRIDLTGNSALGNLSVSLGDWTSGGCGSSDNTFTIREQYSITTDGGGIRAIQSLCLPNKNGKIVTWSPNSPAPGAAYDTVGYDAFETENHCGLTSAQVALMNESDAGYQQKILLGEYSDGFSAQNFVLYNKQLHTYDIPSSVGIYSAGWWCANGY